MNYWTCHVFHGILILITQPLLQLRIRPNAVPQSHKFLKKEFITSIIESFVFVSPQLIYQRQVVNFCCKNHQAKN
jgi:hypothetical protein